MIEIRRQLTLFIEEAYDNIENVRSEFNPKQFNLIPAHVTLCREDEIEQLDDIIERIKSICLAYPIRVKFGEVKRFANGEGVLIPAMEQNVEFIELRKLVLGQKGLKKKQTPHITLMHPRNSTCSDELFEKIKARELPVELEFRKISLIEQINGGKWKVLQEFNIVNEESIRL